MADFIIMIFRMILGVCFKPPVMIIVGIFDLLKIKELKDIFEGLMDWLMMKDYIDSNTSK